MTIELVRAPNPGPLTGPGTNTYVIGSAGETLVLDPGPVINEHLDAIRVAVAGSTLVGVVVTHTHPDHAPAANGIGAEFAVPVFGFADGPGFTPTNYLDDGSLIDVGSTSLVTVHTPGHTPDHVCFGLGDSLFTGDHIVGGSTVIVEDAVAYMASLEKVSRLDPGHLYPGHGPDLPEARRTIDEYIAHRIEREQQVLTAVRDGAGTTDEIVDVVYAGLDPSLRSAAAFQVDTQLRKLNREGWVVLEEGGALGTTVRPVERA